MRTFSTGSRPACGRPPAAAVLGRQRPDGDRRTGLTQRPQLVAQCAVIIDWSTGSEPGFIESHDQPYRGLRSGPDS